MFKMAIRSFFVFFVIGVAAAGASGQIVLGDIWTPIVQSDLRTSVVEQQRLPREFRAYRLNQAELEVVLNRAPMEFRGGAEEVIELPMPDGRFERFNIEHSPVAEPGLYTLYPELAATYRGRGIDDPTATVRFDLMPTGFHAMIRRAGDTVVIDPYGDRASNEYITYYKKDAERTAFECDVEDTIDELVKARGFEGREFLTASAPEVISGTQLRTYRLALAGNWEYCNVAGSNTVAGCLAAMTTVMNRVNGVYERDVALRMIMVATNNLIVYTGDSTNCAGGPCTSANDPYSNGSGALSQNTPNLNTVIGVANYDIGHVFTTGSGGVANLAVPCGSNKGGGTTGLGSPFGDPFAIDYVAHEMGHQWGANHTFNGSSGSCSGGNRSASNSYEPGSGITIMAYAGICGGQDLAANSIDTFHVRSIEAIVAYSQTGNGNSCPVTTASGNTPPTVTGPGDFNIPKQTPFYLTATASDPDNDTLTYDWQQYNTGGSTGTSSIPNTDADGVPRPIFRPFTPTTNPTRTFPAMQHILNSNNIPPSTTGAFLTGELLPAITRTLTFQVIVRDNRANTGAVNTARVDLSVDGNSGPFAVTSPNTAVTYGASSQQTVTWDVANTSNAPVNAANVEISLSTDGGVTFPHVLAASTANDGSETVTLPNVNTSTARIKVQAVGNIFFDVSNANFTITSGATPTPTSTPTATPTNTPTATPTSTPTATPTPSNGFEGDVSPRPNGDNVLNASDVIQLRRFGTGLDTPDAGSEFARADCAPLGTGGDGIVNSADVIQGRRFATGLDPMTNARPFGGGGEISSLFEGIFAYFGKREIRLGEAVPMGGRMAFPIELRGTGDEAAVSFTLEYDASRLGRPQISLGDGVAAGAILTVNANEPGRIGLLLDSSAAIAKAGRSRIVMITFETAGIDLPRIPVLITSSLAAQNISDAKGNSLAARYSAYRSRL